jgi:hypothetical protein
MTGFVSTVLTTAYDRGVGIAVVVFETEEQADQLLAGIVVGRELRPGVVVRRAEVLEVNASER